MREAALDLVPNIAHGARHFGYVRNCSCNRVMIVRNSGTQDANVQFGEEEEEYNSYKRRSIEKGSRQVEWQWAALYLLHGGVDACSCRCFAGR